MIFGRLIESVQKSVVRAKKIINGSIFEKRTEKIVPKLTGTPGKHYYIWRSLGNRKDNRR